MARLLSIDNRTHARLSLFRPGTPSRPARPAMRAHAVVALLVCGLARGDNSTDGTASSDDSTASSDDSAGAAAPWQPSGALTAAQTAVPPSYDGLMDVGEGKVVLMWDPDASCGEGGAWLHAKATPGSCSYRGAR